MISGMRSKFSIWIILIFHIKVNNGQEMKNISTIRRRGNLTNGVELKDMISRCQPNSDEYCYLTEAIEFVVFGEPKDPTEIDRFLDTLLDNGTLDSVLQFGIGQLYLFAQDNPQLMPGKIKNKTNSDLSETPMYFRRLQFHPSGSQANGRTSRLQWFPSNYWI